MMNHYANELNAIRRGEVTRLVRFMMKRSRGTAYGYPRLWIPSGSVDAKMAADLKAGLVGAWPLDESVGVRRDHSGLGNNLTDNATVTGNPGPSVNIPQASQFTLANAEYLSVADTPTLDMGAGVQMLISAWVYMDSKPAANMSIAGKWNVTGNQRSYVLDWDNLTDRFRFIVSADGITPVVADITLAPSLATWYFIRGRYDGANIILSASPLGSGTTAFSTDIFASTAAFEIGSRNAGTMNWDGRIADVNVWKGTPPSTQGGTWLYNDGLGRSISQRRLAA